MRNKIRLLVELQTSNLFGFNEFRHTKDKKIKRRWIGMAAIWAMLTGFLVAYVALFSYGMISIGLGHIVPEYLFMITSLVILFFSMFKAGSVLFQMNTYEALISLPVSKAAIVVSRFLSMYISNLLLSLFVMLPGIVLYGVWIRPGVGFYAFSILGTIFLPLLPMTVAAIFGSLITAVSSRMRNKSIVNSALTVLLVVGIIAFSSSSAGNLENISGDMLKSISAVVTAEIEKLYPPAVWFGKSAVSGSLPSFLQFIGVSAGLFLAMVLVVQHFFTGICTALNATTAKKNYKMRSLDTNSPVTAMFRRELKRYFASSIYVTNTIIGYILMAAASVALYVMGPGKLEASLGYPGLITRAFPLFLAAMGALITPASCSISMEGKQWWIAKSIPVRSKDIFDSKILAALAIALPEYLIAVCFGLLAVKPSFLGAIWIIVIPAAYIAFSAVSGIAVNLAMPVFNWENETRAVKQSASVMVTMLISLLGFVPPIVCLLVKTELPADFVLFTTLLVILAATAILYGLNNKKQIVRIE
jgi:ABC-2 type transport system permease protein